VKRLCEDYSFRLGVSESIAKDGKEPERKPELQSLRVSGFKGLASADRASFSSLFSASDHRHTESFCAGRF
jgi:hypothetical protein